MCIRDRPRHLHDMESFAVIGATIADNFGIELPTIGQSILELIK